MENVAHYVPLFVAYGVAIGAVMVANSSWRTLWPRADEAAVRRPWIEFVAILVALAGVVAIGSTLHARGLTGRHGGRFGPLLDVGVEVTRFSPLLVFLVAMRPTWASIWIPARNWPIRLALGVLLGAAALVAFAIASGRGTALLHEIAAGLAKRGPRPATAALHIFLEDLAIAAIGARLVAVCRQVWLAGVIVAVLFALGHVPALIQEGLQPVHIAALALDALLGVGIFLALAKTRDFLWFWPVHVAMDMTQFAMP